MAAKSSGTCSKKSHVQNPYRGLGSFSSGNGVHTESGVFCSLNRPQNTFSMSAMEKAQTAEPGILRREKQIHVTPTLDFCSLYCVSSCKA